VRLYLVPHTHYVFYDEYEHINIAKNLAETRQFSRCDSYLDNKCLSAFLPNWTPGYHFLLALIFKIFGISEAVAFNFNAFLGVISIAVLFLLTYLVTSSNTIALISAALLSFTPLHLKYSGNSSLEMCSLVFILLSTVSVLIFTRLQTRSSFFQFLTVVAYTTLLRPENGVVVLLFLSFIVLNRINLKKFVKLSYLLILFLPCLFYLPNIKAYTNNYWLSGRESVSLAILLMQNLWFWFNNAIVPLSCSLLAIIGVYLSRKNKEKSQLFLILYFFTFLFVYTFIHKARIDISDLQRYNLQFYFPVVIFASIGMYGIVKLLCRMQKIKWIAVGILFSVLILNFTNINQSSQYLKQDDYLCNFQKQYKQFLNGRELDPGYVFIAYNPPSIISTIGRSSVNISYLFNNEVYGNFLKSRRLVLANDFWCQQDRDGMCSALKNKYALEKIESKQGADLGMFYYLKAKE
jgi:4-amino-4-deoxy-L-arabinose transferase-like glycosyltransferase